MVVVIQRYKAERLRNQVGAATNRLQYFRHAVHGTGLSLESDFNEIALGQGF